MAFDWYKTLLGLPCLFAVSACPGPKGACWDSGAAGGLWVGQAFFFTPGEDAAAFFVDVAIHADLQKREVLGNLGREGKVAGPNSYRATVETKRATTVATPIRGIDLQLLVIFMGLSLPRRLTTKLTCRYGAPAE